MASLPPLEFTLDGPGLTLGQIGAVLKYQTEMAARRASREAAKAGQAKAEGRRAGLAPEEHPEGIVHHD